MDSKKEMNGFVKSAIASMNSGSDQKPDNSPELEKAHYDSDRYVKWFSELSNKDIPIAGGKGASLAEMFNAKFPVPPGFSITTHAFESFMSANALCERIADIVQSVGMEETESLQKASKEIRAMVEKQEMPKEMESEILEAYHILGAEKIDERGISKDALNILKNAQEPPFVSVRSSATTEDLATASFAGQQDTFLNVKGDRALLVNVKKCFSSLYTARAIYYRNKQGFKEGEALLSIVIQKMVDSEKSGVMFSKDPTNKTKDIIVEAVYGLGEGIVSGRISPDHYVIDHDLKIKSIQTAEKKTAIVRNSSGKNETVRLSPERSKSQVLTNGEVLESADFAMKLEAHYKKPQDIEFAYEDKKLYILQSRPVTTIKESEEGEKGEQGEISGNVLLTGLGSSPGIGVGTVRIIDSMADLSKIKKGDILVTEMTNPDMVVAMEKSTAIVTNEGGMTSHAAIVSREIGIPCIVGTSEATSVLKDGMKITVDGSSGKVYEGEVAKTTSVEIKPALDVERIKLKVIVDLPNSAERAAKTEIDSIGLTRIEGMIASMGKHPLLYEKEDNLDAYTKLLTEGMEKIIAPFKQMWIRASDIRTDEYASLKGAPEREINPMLGLHGIRFSLKHPKILDAEFQAIRNVADKNPDKKIGIMFPQVISVEEVKQAKEHYKKFETSNMEFGVMVETPAAVQIIDEICEVGIDFISFGTNDLTQFTLGVDRGEDEVQHLYDEMHPAVLSQIKRVIGACKRHKVQSSICGQAGSKKEMVEFLFPKGITSISVNADAAYDVSKTIKDLEEVWKKEEGERLKEEERLKKEEEEKARLQAEEDERVRRLKWEETERAKLRAEAEEERRLRDEEEAKLEAEEAERASDNDVTAGGESSDEGSGIEQISGQTQNQAMNQSQNDQEQNQFKRKKKKRKKKKNRKLWENQHDNYNAESSDEKSPLPAMGSTGPKDSEFPTYDPNEMSDELLESDEPSVNKEPFLSDVKISAEPHKEKVKVDWNNERVNAGSGDGGGREGSGSDGGREGRVNGEVRERSGGESVSRPEISEPSEFDGMANEIRGIESQVEKEAEKEIEKVSVEKEEREYVENSESDLDDLDNLGGRINDIQENVDESNEDDLDRDEEIEEGIEVSGGRVDDVERDLEREDSDEGGEVAGEVSGGEGEGGEDEGEEVSEGEVSNDDEGEEDENQPRGDEWQDSEDDEVDDDGVEEVSDDSEESLDGVDERVSGGEDEGEEVSGGEDGGSSEVEDRRGSEVEDDLESEVEEESERVGSDVGSEGVGVYNPESEEGNVSKKQKFNYNFDEFDDYQ